MNATNGNRASSLIAPSVPTNEIAGMIKAIPLIKSAFQDFLIKPQINNSTEPPTNNHKIIATKRKSITYSPLLFNLNVIRLYAELLLFYPLTNKYSYNYIIPQR